MARRTTQGMYPTVRTEGGLLPPDLLARIADLDAAVGLLKPEDYGLEPGERINDEIDRAWTGAKNAWAGLRHVLARQKKGENPRSLTENYWHLPLLRELGYLAPGRKPRAEEAGGRRFPISFQADPIEDRDAPAMSPPVHLVSWEAELDRGPHEGALRATVTQSPHGLLQDYLNWTDHLWGIVTNGRTLRLLRDNQSLSRAAFVEFDLEAMMESGAYADFRLLWLAAHRSRLPIAGEAPDGCALERWRGFAEDEGARAHTQLRAGVRAAIVALGQGFLDHPANRDTLAAKLAAGSLSTEAYYRQLLRLVYRMIFLFAAEERDLLFPPLPEGVAPDGPEAARLDRQRDVYQRFYSATRLRDLVDNRRGRDRHDDLWRSLRLLFTALSGGEGGEGAASLGIPPLGGLFEPGSLPDLDGASLGNTALLDAVRGLSWARTEDGKRWRRVNYRDMDVEELGSVYEGLLEEQPHLTGETVARGFTLDSSGERKSTGSYYTNPGLVAELIRSALDPVIERAISGIGHDGSGHRASGTTAPGIGHRASGIGHGDAEGGEGVAPSSPDTRYPIPDTQDPIPDTQDPMPDTPRSRLLALKVCDPACGSGHFLLAAARRIGREVARIDAGGLEPTPQQERHALREAIRHCVYGVDLNEMAVDLCRTALWLEGHDPGKPMAFLEAHVRRGNSLVGATAAVMSGGVPDEAFDPVTGDDKAVASAVKKRNRQQAKGQLGLESGGLQVQSTGGALARWIEFEARPDESLADIRDKRKAWQQTQASPAATARKLQADLWTAAFFWPLRPGAPEPPTHAEWLRLSRDPHLVDYISKGGDPALKASASGRTVRLARDLSREHAFFHWELAFPEVFDRDEPGFDCILGNPPWERVKLQEQEFFAQRSPAIATAPNAAARKKAIAALEKSAEPRDRDLFAAFGEAKAGAEKTSGFLRQSGRFPLTGQGDVNLYSVFAELAATLPSPAGQSGVIVPTGIATDDGNKRFFGWLVERGRLRSLFDFENRRPMFHNVDSRMKFSLLTASGRGRRSEGFAAAFFLHDPADLRDPERTFTLTTEEIELLNPNTRTCPIFRSRRDAEITLALYRAAPVLVREADPARGVAEENPWGVSFKTMFHMANDSHLFRTREELEQAGLELGADGRFRGGGACWLPLYEAKMIHQYDHRWATYTPVKGDAEKTRDLSLEEKADPNTLAIGRYWVDEREVEDSVDFDVLGGETSKWSLGFRRVARNTDERSAIFSLLPWAAAGDSVFFLRTLLPAMNAAALYGNSNTLVFDYIVRQKAGGINFNFFIVKQLPVLPPETYTPILRDEIANRVLRLTYTAWDMEPFARDLGYEGEPFRWDEEERAVLRAELDGIYAHLYGVSRADFDYILGTFPIVNRKDEARYGEERTRRMCLEAHDYYAPEALSRLRDAVAEIEVALKAHVVEVLGNSLGAVQDTVWDKYAKERERRANRSPLPERPATLKELLAAGYIDWPALLMKASANRERFAARFGSKDDIHNRMWALTDLRNALSHPDEMVIPGEKRAKGEAAIRWWAERLGVKVGIVAGVSVERG